MTFRLWLFCKTFRLLLYVIWREWICGQDSAVHPIETFVLLVKIACGVDLGRVQP